MPCRAIGRVTSSRGRVTARRWGPGRAKLALGAAGEDERCHHRLRPRRFYPQAQPYRGALRQSLTDDQGQEGARHAELTAQTGVKVSCCDPDSPWQRGSCENPHGLLRQYLPKGTDLARYSREPLDAIAERLNQRPRAIHGYFPRISVYRAMMERLNQPKSAVH